MLRYWRVKLKCDYNRTSDPDMVVGVISETAVGAAELAGRKIQDDDYYVSQVECMGPVDIGLDQGDAADAD